MKRERRARGTTLVELVISIVVIGIAVSGTLLAVNHTVARSGDPPLQQTEPEREVSALGELDHAERTRGFR